MYVVDFINALFCGVFIVITSFGDVLIWSVMLLTGSSNDHCRYCGTLIYSLLLFYSVYPTRQGGVVLFLHLILSLFFFLFRP